MGLGVIRTDTITLRLGIKVGCGREIPGSRNSNAHELR